MKKLILWLTGLLPFIMTLVFYNRLPQENIPIHFNPSGTPDKFTTKQGLLVFALFMVLPAVLIYFLAVFSEKKKADTDEKSAASGKVNSDIFCIVGSVIELVLTAIFGIIITRACSDVIDDQLTTKLALAITSLMFIAMGNYLPKTKRNSFIGMRTAHSQYNDVTWLKSNRFCGYSCMVSGVLSLAAALFLPKMVAIIFILAVFSTAIVASIIYSEKVYKDVVDKA